MLFRTVTGEDWNRVLHDCMLSPPYCTTKGTYPSHIFIYMMVHVMLELRIQCVSGESGLC